MQQTTKSLLLIFFLIPLYRADKKLPNYIKPCNRNDPELSKCWRTTLQFLKPYFAKGLTEFRMPPLEPFHVEKLKFNMTGTSSLNFVADLYNLTLNGIGEYTVTDADVKFENGEYLVKASLAFPRITLKGKYDAVGKVLLLEFNGNGDIDGDFKEVTANIVWHLNIVKRDGKEYLQTREDSIDLTIKNIYLYMHNLFRNNPEISANLNKVINENIDVLYDDFKPLLSTTISRIITTFSGNVFRIFTYDTLLHK